MLWCSCSSFTIPTSGGCDINECGTLNHDIHTINTKCRAGGGLVLQLIVAIQH
jgi:hypothetical protein